MLPTAGEAFAEDSVVEAWGGRLAAVLDTVEQRGGTIRSLGRPPGEEAHREANQVILDSAVLMSSGEEQTTLLVIASPGEGVMIEDIVTRAERLGVETLRIDPRRVGQGGLAAPG